MARITGVEPRDASVLTKVAYGMVRRKVGKVVMPIKIHAHHPTLFQGMAFMESAQDRARMLDPVVKTLAQIRVATLIGCPF